MITIEGTIPFPPATDAQAMTAMGAGFAQLAASLQGSSSQIASTATTVQSGWTGTASNAMAGSMAKKAATSSGTAGVLASVQPIMTTFAAAVTAAEAAYTTAVYSEYAAEAGLPWTAGALAAALAAETAAVVSLETAGAACAASLMAVIGKLGLQELQQLGSEAMNFVTGPGGLVNQAVSALNSTTSIANSNGTTTLIHNLGAIIQSAAGPTVNAVQSVVGAVGLVTEPVLTTNAAPLTNQTNPNGTPTTVAQALQNQNFAFNPQSPGQVGQNQSLLESIQRGTGSDESLVVAHSLTDNGTSKTLTLQFGGIVSPADGSMLPSEGSGTRNLGNAGVSQTTGLGQEETALYNWVQQQGLQPGDTVNIYAHSQGGIVAQNLNDALSAQGLQVNVVTTGSPDQQQPANSQVYWMQNPADPVVATKAFGDSAVGNTLSASQSVITVNTPGATAINFQTHNASLYGSWADQNPGAPGMSSLNAFLQQQAPAVGSTVTNGVTAFQGPTVPTPEGTSAPGLYVIPK